MTMRCLHPTSLRLRLALWYLLVLGLVLIVFSTIIYVHEGSSLFDSVDMTLSSRAETVASQVRVDPDGVRYQNADAPAAEAETAVYLFHANGRLAETVSGATKLPWQRKPVLAALGGHDNYTTVDRLRVYSAGLRDDAGHVVGAVQIVHSLRGIDAHLNRLLLLLALATPALLTGAAFGGSLLASHALGPLERITRIAQEIKAGHLDERLGMVARDDEIGRLASTFDDMLDRLEHAFTQQRQFVADASHELRTPLTILRGDLDVLLRRPRSAAEYEETFQGINEEVTRLSAMVEALLMLARADSGQAEIARETLYLDAIIEDAIGGISRVAAARSITVDSVLPPDVTIVGDPTWLHQLMLNLLSNAIKYTPADGKVRVILTTEGPWARVDVADTGCGIAEQDLPRVFNRFFRTDEARTRTEGGTGLGLAIARWCAEIHGGRLTVVSQVGQGSVFTVRLPLAERTEWADEEGVVALPAAGSVAG